MIASLYANCQHFFAKYRYTHNNYITYMAHIIYYISMFYNIQVTNFMVLYSYKYTKKLMKKHSRCI